MHFFIRDLNTAPELAQGIGNLIVAWSCVDVAMLTALARSSKTSQQVAAKKYFSYGEGFGRRKEGVLLSIYRNSHNLPDHKRTVAAIDEIEGHSKLRNQIVHGGWGAGSEKHGDVFVRRKLPILFDYRGKKSPRKIYITPEMINSHCEGVMNATTKLFVSLNVDTDIPDYDEEALSISSS